MKKGVWVSGRCHESASGSYKISSINRNSGSACHEANASIPHDVAGRRNSLKPHMFLQALAYLEPLLKKQNLKASFVGLGQAAARMQVHTGCERMAMLELDWRSSPIKKPLLCCDCLTGSF